MRDHGRRTLLRGKCHASRGVQHLGGSRSGACCAQSKLPIELVGWQTSRGAAVLYDGDISHLQTFRNRLSHFAIECNSRARDAYKEQTGEDGISLPDPIAMSIAIDPTIGIEWSQHHVDIETTSELTRGMTVVDRLGVASDERNRPIWDATLQNQSK